MKVRGGSSGFRALGVLVFALGAASGTGAEVRPGEPVFALRAEHMILDAALRGSQVLAGTQSGRVEVFDWRRGRALAPLFATKPAEGRELAPTVPSVALSPSGAMCAVISSDGRLRVFRLDGDGASHPILSMDRTGLAVSRFANERWLLLGDMRGELAVVDLPTGRELHRRQLEYDPIYVLAPSPDGSRVAVAFRSSRIQIVKCESGETSVVLKGHRDSVFGVVWLDENQLASAGKDKRLLAWDLREPGSPPRVLYAADHYITALAVDPHAGLLALPLEDHHVGLLRTSDGEIVRRLAGHTAPVRALLFADGGETLISAGSDARILVWDVARGGQGRLR